MSNLKVHKSGASQHNALKDELVSLRKGDGFQAAKFRNLPNAIACLARIAGLSAESITPNQAYNLFLAELARLPDTVQTRALNYALGIGATSPRLAVRRQELADTLHKHTDTIERYENQAFEHLITRLLDKRYETPAVPSNGLAAVDNRELQTEALRQATTHSLAGMLGLDRYASDLTRFLQAAGPVYLDASVKIRLTDSPRGPGWYRYHMHYLFSGIRRSFRMALVFSPADGEQLMTSGLVDEYCVVNDPATPRREARTILNSTTLQVSNPQTGRQKLLRFRPLDDLALEDLYNSLDQSLSAPCWVFQTEIPGEWHNEEMQYEYSTAFDLVEGVTSAYWYAPRMMYLHSLEWDFSRFPNSQKYRFKLLPFLGNAVGSTYTQNKMRMTFRPNNWIMPAHGVCLSWYNI